MSMMKGVVRLLLHTEEVILESFERIGWVYAVLQFIEIKSLFAWYRKASNGVTATRPSFLLSSEPHRLCQDTMALSSSSFNLVYIKTIKQKFPVLTCSSQSIQLYVEAACCLYIATFVLLA